MRLRNSLVALLFPLALFAQQEDMQKALQEFLLMMEQTTKTLKDLSQTQQTPIPEEQNSWQLYYKVVQNGAKVEKRNDLLIKTQISYQLLKEKSIPSSLLLVVVKDGVVELFGKLYSQKGADKAIDIALHTRGVKKVISYIIMKLPAKTLI